MNKLYTNEVTTKDKTVIETYLQTRRRKFDKLFVLASMHLRKHAVPGARARARARRSVNGTLQRQTQKTQFVSENSKLEQPYVTRA